MSIQFISILLSLLLLSFSTQKNSDISNGELNAKDFYDIDYTQNTLNHNISDVTPTSRIHYIHSCSSDAILIESHGKFGLVDSGNPYIGQIPEVQKVVIDPSKGEKDQGTHDPDCSVKGVIDYLEKVGVKKLEFLIGTHAHSDHIGGIPAIAYKFVDSNTKYYHRSYRQTAEERTHPDWANHAYFNAAYNSMKIKKAQLIDVTGTTPSFSFGDLKITILNAYIHKEETKHGENQNSIVELITVGKHRFFLAADMIASDDMKLKDIVGKLDVLKLAHHGWSESSYSFISTTRPKYTVVTNSKLPEYGGAPVSYIQNILHNKVYMTGNVPAPSKDLPKAAIILNVYKKNNEFEYSLENTGSEINISDRNGWIKWHEYFVFLESGKLATGWRQIKWGKFWLFNRIDWFYFNDSGLMATGWQFLEWKKGKNWFFFEETNGFMATGFQKLKWSKGINWFYFNETDGFMVTGWQELVRLGKKCKFYFDSNGVMYENKCYLIEGRRFCFDKNGCFIKGPNK